MAVHTQRLGALRPRRRTGRCGDWHLSRFKFVCLAKHVACTPLAAKLPEAERVKFFALASWRLGGNVMTSDYCSRHRVQFDVVAIVIFLGDILSTLILAGIVVRRILGIM